MTALTTVAGMLPLAFSEQTGEGIPYHGCYAVIAENLEEPAGGEISLA
jgi:hypothetical protein